MRIDISNLLNKSNVLSQEQQGAQRIKSIGPDVLPEKGQLLEGEILDILQNKVTIRLLNGQQITAKMLESFPFKIGERLTFEIKDSTKDQLTLKPMIEGNATLKNIADILNNAKLEDSTKNIDIVKQLMENNMPVNKETVQQIHMYTKRFPEAKLDTIIFLVKNNMIVAEDSIRYVDELIHNQQNLSKEFTSFARMASTLIKEPDMSMILEKFVEADHPNYDLLKTAMSLVEGDGKLFNHQEGLLRQQLQPNQMEQIQTTLRESVLPQLPEDVKSLVGEKLPMITSLNSMDALNNFFEELDIPKTLRIYIKESLAERITENVLNQSTLLGRNALERYADISKHFNKVYERMVDVLNMKQQNEGSPSEEKFFKEVQQLKTGLEAMSHLQQNFQFIHLPVMLNQEFVNSQLYIMNKKNGRKSNDERITALLRLDFKNLGQMDVYIAKHSKNVEINFYVEGESAEKLLQENSIHLHKELLNKSFNVLGLGVRIKDSQLEEVEDFFKEQSSKSTPKRFTFDVRA